MMDTDGSMGSSRRSVLTGPLAAAAIPAMGFGVPAAQAAEEQRLGVRGHQPRAKPEFDDRARKTSRAVFYRAEQLGLIGPRVDYEQEIVRLDLLIVHHIQLNQRPLYVRQDPDQIGADIGVIRAWIAAAQPRRRDETPNDNRGAYQTAQNAQRDGRRMAHRAR
jgi:hypothetical protein